METENRYIETGSSPYYLNLNNSALEFSSQETSNPAFGFLEIINNNVIFDSEREIVKPRIEQDFVVLE